MCRMVVSVDQSLRDKVKVGLLQIGATIVEEDYSGDRFADWAFKIESPKGMTEVLDFIWNVLNINWARVKRWK